MSVSKYLQIYAEAEIRLASRLTGKWRQVICIPAFDEEEALPALIKRLQHEHNLLAILVLNSPATSSVLEARQRTQALARTLRHKFTSQQRIDEASALLTLNSENSHLLLLERYDLPAQEGVGLARKIACDLACQLIHEDKISSSWIHNTDADVELPDDYFSSTPNTNVAAGIYPKRHAPNPDSLLNNCLRLYDYSLNYYLAGLRWASSPYAFPTIGSTLLINHRHYALARGFPKRAAAEDFYLLNKLAKIGDIQILDTMPLVLSGRASSRAPFGTGPALNQISKLDEPDRDYLFYHPNCFLYVKKWLTLMPEIWHKKALDGLIDNDLLMDCLYTLGLEKAVSHALRHSKNSDSFQKHMHNWFDAFRSLKLIHLLRDGGLNAINFEHLQSMKSEFEFIHAANQSAPGINS